MMPATALSTVSQSALIVAHFHREGLLRSDTIEALHWLQGCFDKIFLVSTNLQEGERLKLPDSVELIVRENIGYDFYSYREGILRLQAASGPWEITLMNTSFVITDPAKFTAEVIWNGVQALDFDCLGLTKSLEINEHVQSFLVSFSTTLTSDPRFTAWWRDMVPLNERYRVVVAYEIGLSAAVTQWGYQLHGLYQLEGRYRGLNPSHYNYMQLLQKYGILKIQVFKANPCGVDLEPLMTQASTDPALVQILLEGCEN
jgi:rhamnosyltransferase